MTDNHVLHGMPRPLRAVLIGNILNHIFFKDYSQGYISKGNVAEKFEQYFRINVDEAVKTIDMTLSDFVTQNFKGIIVIKEPAGFAFEAQAQANTNNYASTVPSITAPLSAANDNAAAKADTKSAPIVEPKATASAPEAKSTPVIKEEPKAPTPRVIKEEPKASPPTPVVKETPKAPTPVPKENNAENIPPKLSEIPELEIDWDKISAPQKVTKKPIVA